MLLSIGFHMEQGNPRKLAGIGLAVAGAICMVAGGAASAAHGHHVTDQVRLLSGCVVMAPYIPSRGIAVHRTFFCVRINKQHILTVVIAGGQQHAAR